MPQYNISFPIRENIGRRYKDWCELLDVRRYLEGDLQNMHGVEVMGAGTFLGDGGAFDIDVEMRANKKKAVQTYLLTAAKDYGIKDLELN